MFANNTYYGKIYDDSPLITFSFSQAIYRGEYKHNIKGKMIPTDKTVDLERAYHANKIQSEVSINILFF